MTDDNTPDDDQDDDDTAIFVELACRAEYEALADDIEEMLMADIGGES